MKQVSLFERQERFDDGLDYIVQGLLRRGNAHKFIEVHIRKYQIDSGMDLSSVLKALREVEDHTKGLCISLAEISSLNLLKKRKAKTKDELTKYFRSSIEDKYLIIETDLDEIRSLAEQLNRAYINVTSTAFRIFTENGDVELSDRLRQLFLDLWEACGLFLKEIDQISKK